MVPQTETNCVIAWGEELGIPIVLITNKEGEWLPPNSFPTGLIKNKKLREKLSQACFGFFFLAFSLLFSPSRVRAMQSSEAQAVVSQAILERPTREHQLREQASTEDTREDARMELLSKRRNHLLFAIRKNPRIIRCPRGIDWSMEEAIHDTFPYYRSHPTIEAEVIERGMREYDPTIILPQRLWTWNYDSGHRLKMTIYRLGSLVYYRENTVSRYIASSTMGGDIEESMDNTISIAMKAVAEEILVGRRKDANIYLSTHDHVHINEIRKILFWKTVRLKEDTEKLIEKSQCEIKEAESKQLKSADSE